MDVWTGELWTNNGVLLDFEISLLPLKYRPLSSLCLWWIMATIDLGVPADNALEFYIRRSEALDGYASVEQSLAQILALLLESDKYASSIFFRITNSSARCRIIQDLLEQKYEDKYSNFWHGIPKTKNRRGIMNLIHGLDAMRNQIVHWHTVCNIGTYDGVTKNILILKPPMFWVGSNMDAELTVSDMVEFRNKASFVSRSLNMFALCLNEHVKDVFTGRDRWLEILKEPCIYPPPPDHPLAHSG